MGVGVGIAEVVDRDDLDFAGALGFEQGAQHVAADAAVAIDTNTYGHEGDSIFCRAIGEIMPRVARRAP